MTQPLVVAATLLAHEELTKRGLLAGTAPTSWSPDTPSARSPPTRSPASSPPTTPSKLAATRGAEMAKACALEPTGMSAVLGGDEAEVLGPPGGTRPGPRQPQRRRPDRRRRRAVARWTSSPRIRRPRPGCASWPPPVRSTPTTWPPALDGYAAAADGVTTAEPTATLLSNADGQPVASAADAMTKLVAQLTRPVRWDLCTETHASAARCDARSSSSRPRERSSESPNENFGGCPTHAVKTPADLDGLAEL